MNFEKGSVQINLENGDHVLIGEVSIDESLHEIIDFTDIQLIQKRIKKNGSIFLEKKQPQKKIFRPAAVPNKVILGNCIDVLEEFPPDTAQLVFTSPPYYNAKPEYSEYVDYQEYLDFMRRVIIRVHSILSEGRFFVINVSPVLVRRTSRNTSSRRLPTKINGDYDVTNVWRIHPGYSKIHPAVFPDELAEKVIRYYSFKKDLVLDPFAGSGTVGRVAYKLERRFLLIDNEPKYYKYMKDTLGSLIPITSRIDFNIHEKFKKENNGY